MLTQQTIPNKAHSTCLQEAESYGRSTVVNDLVCGDLEAVIN